MDNPYLGFAKVATLFAATTANASSKLHPSAVIDESVTLGCNLTIGAHVVIEAGCSIADNVTIEAGTVIGQNCVIGAHSHLRANVTLYSDVVMGEHCTIHSGAVIGSDGFGFAPNTDKEAPSKWFKVPQVGGVRIGNYVDIGAQTAIDRGAIEPTIIEDGVILDNHIQVGHNVVIGKNTAIAGFVPIAGSAVIGANCTIGGSSGINGHITIADNTVIAGGTNVTHSIKTPGAYGGPLSFDTLSSWKRNALSFNKLSDLIKRVRRLEKHLTEKQS